MNVVQMWSTETGHILWLTVFTKINCRPFVSSGQIVAHPYSNEDDEQTDGGVQQEINHIPRARITRVEWCRIHVGYVDGKGTDTLL